MRRNNNNNHNNEIILPFSFLDKRKQNPLIIILYTCVLYGILFTEKKKKYIYIPFLAREFLLFRHIYINGLPTSRRRYKGQIKK